MFTKGLNPKWLPEVHYVACRTHHLIRYVVHLRRKAFGMQPRIPKHPTKSVLMDSNQLDFFLFVCLFKKLLICPNQSQGPPEFRKQSHRI